MFPVDADPGGASDLTLDSIATLRACATRSRQGGHDPETAVTLLRYARSDGP